MFYLQRTIKTYSFREFISKTEAKVIGQEKIEGVSALNITNEDAHVQELEVNGFTEFENLIDEATLNQIIASTKPLLLFDPFNKKFGDFRFDDIPAETHVANFRRNDLVTNEAILKIANDPGILKIVQDFLGAVPTISNINMWWSMAGKSKAKDAQLFHRDVDDLKFCKLFIYLTDVGPNDGPHTYVKGSSATNKLTKIRRYEDAEIEDAFGKDSIINFCRPKGSFFIVNTYGFHKGTLPIENNRLLLQVQYSLNPIGIETYNPINIDTKYNKYINRLLVK
jgi:hypothetical protein